MPYSFLFNKNEKKNLEKIMPENMHKKLLHACGIEFMEEEIKGKFLFIDLLPFGYSI